MDRDTIAEIDAEIERHLAQVRALRAQLLEAEVQARELRSHRNSLQHISRLPTEVLQLVFTRLVPTVFHKQSEAKSIVQWIQITAVCSHWRQVAISFPLLWHHITEDLTQEWALAFMERSAPGLFDIAVNLGHQRELSNAILQNISRVRTLRISGDMTAMLSLVKDMTSEASWLQHLEVIPTPLSMRRVELDHLFSCKVPRLTALDLGQHATIQVRSPLLPQLELFSSSRPLSINRVQKMLSRIPRAYSVRLICAPSFHNEDATLVPLYLPSIRVLHLVLQEPMKTIRLLQSLTLPALSSLKLTISLNLRVWLPEEEHQLAMPIAPYTCQVEQNEGVLRELEVGEAGSTQTFHASPIDKGADVADQPGVTIHFDWSCLSLVSDGFQPPASLFVQPVLSLFDKVEVLTLSGQSRFRDCIVKCASPQYRHSPAFADPRGSEPCALALLKKLVIKTHRIHAHGGRLLHELREFLADRQSAGVAIQELDFVDCKGYSAHFASELQSWVKVTWDGKEIEPLPLDLEDTGVVITNVFNAPYSVLSL
ncbi:hypothetical protein EWM64_g2653 [Hericium alpestre]|uniref:F-box domain-containing protein n=1 Tax=Hericium alpestre TaxID=135208 RepID=A0A4Z0A6S8_9AGAM|nr:hypothetical protein EWM64_g2653 [Hericium alpestre]